MGYGTVERDTLSMEAIQGRIAPALKSSETQLKGILSKLGHDSSPAELLEAQSAMANWTARVQLQSALVKEIGDAIKGIIQKSG